MQNKINLSTSLQIKSVTETLSTLTNSTPINVATALQTPLPYASQIIITTATIQRSYPLSLIVINDNITRGNLFATYSVKLDKDELVEEQIVQIALSNNGTNVISTFFVNLTKTAEELYISITVSLITNLNFIALSGGSQNFLVRALLGESAFIPSEYSLRWGTSLIDGEVALTPTANQSDNQIPVSINFIANSIQFTATVPPFTLDAVLLARGQPALRIALHTMANHIFVGQVVANLEQVVVSQSATIETVTNLTQGSTSHMARQAEILEIPSGFTQLTESLAMEFNEDFTLHHDPSCRSVAFVGLRELHFIGMRNGIPQVLARLDRRGAEVFLPYHNTVVFVYPTYASIYHYTHENGLSLTTKINFTNQTEGRCMVAKQGEHFLIIREVLGCEFWERGVIIGNAYIVQEMQRVTGNEIYFRNRYFLGVITGDKQAFSFGINGLDLTTTNNLQRFINQNDSVEFRSLNDGLVFATVTNSNIRQNLIYSMFSDRLMLGLADTTTVMLRGDYITVILENGTRQLRYFRRDTMTLWNFAVADMPNIIEAVRLDKFLLTRKADGSLDAYAITPQATAIYHPNLQPNLTTNFIARGLFGVDELGNRRIKLNIE
ncbi:MAG: hypothetical protein FWE13_02370 [Firmicutes bacterium]|nr:hypothetical protein [Bacillota bacterium]